MMRTEKEVRAKIKLLHSYLEQNEVAERNGFEAEWDEIEIQNALSELKWILNE